MFSKKIQIQTMSLLAAGILPLASAQAQDGLELRPRWASHYELARQPNISYLSNRTRIRRSSEAEFLGRLFEDPEANDQYRYRYERIKNSYEKRLYQQSGFEAEKQYIDEISGLRNEVVHNVKKSQRDQQRKKLRRTIEKTGAVETAQESGTPGRIVGLVGAITFGQPLEFRFGESTFVRWKSNIERQRGEMLFTNPFFESRFDFNGDHAANLDHYNEAVSTDPEARKERYRVKLTRLIPFLNLHSSLIFGGTTQLLSASVSKQLTNEIRAVLGTSRSVNADPRTRSAEQESLSLVYDLRF